MATRGLVDSCINAYLAPGARPTTPKQLLARNTQASSGYKPSKKSVAKDDDEAQFEAFCRMKDKEEKQGKQRQEKERHEKSSMQAVRPDPYADFAMAFSAVSIQVQNREGINSEAVNGTWKYWKVVNGRLAFFREITEEPQNAEAEEDAAPEAEDVTGKSLTVHRLYLFYERILDMWLISDTGSIEGVIVADCGPVTDETDLEQIWRVWGGDGWQPDERVTATVVVDGPPSEMLEGLRVKKIIQPPAQEKPAARRTKQPASART
jgi:hypothetical protein